MRDDLLRLAGEEFIDGLASSRPTRIIVLIERYYSALDYFVVERFQRNLVGFVQIAIQVQQSDLSRVGRQGVLEEALREPYSIAYGALRNLTIEQDSQHG